EVELAVAGCAVGERAVGCQLAAQQRELDLPILPEPIGVVFEARPLEVLDDPAVLDDLLANRVAEDQHSAALAPEREEAGAVAQVVVGLLEENVLGERQR